MRLEVILKRFHAPDEIRDFAKGAVRDRPARRHDHRPRHLSAGLAPVGRRGAATGAKRCQVEHVGMVVAGCTTAATDDGTVVEMKPGDVFYVPPGHDSWVVGSEPYVSLHLLGADDYARKR
jgi:mannose-6-phosphate isomerase-like protein (cupin superfamily)